MAGHSLDAIVARLHALENARNREGMARFGIETKSALGIPIPELRRIAAEVGRDHALAIRLWERGIHEGRILACMCADPLLLSDSEMEKWVAQFDSWDLCDQCCSNLFVLHPLAWEKAQAWAEREEEFVRRAGFVLMAALAVHDRQAPDERFLALFPLIRHASDDGRRYVKKAVNWALRQIGKRNIRLHAHALSLAEELLQGDSASGRWIARDAIRELRSGKIAGRLGTGRQKAGSG